MVAKSTARGGGGGKWSSPEDSPNQRDGKQDGSAVIGAGAVRKAAATDADAKALEEARRKFTRIDAFEGPFAFLSLDAPCEVMWDGAMFKSAHHALLAAQHPDALDDVLAAETLDQAQKRAQEEPEISDWSAKRLKVMEKILRDKFRRSADLRQQLKETGDRELAWENDDDGFWGTVNARGLNHLGRILMEVRTSIEDDTEFNTWLLLCCEMEDNPMQCPPIELLEQKLGTDGATEEKKLHRLEGQSYYKIGKLPSNAVVALHPSLSREHAMLLHSRSKSLSTKSHGLAIMDLGSKAGTTIGERKVKHAFALEPVRSGDLIRLGASTRAYFVRVDLASQIQLLEEQERKLMTEVRIIDADASNPVEAAKRSAREEATVFVGNLDYETEKADLLGLFQDCGGKIEEVRFPGPAGTAKAIKGICFVVFDSAMTARRACGLSGQLFKERRVKVAPASEGRKHDGNPGRRGGVGGDWRLDKVRQSESPARGGRQEADAASAAPPSARQDAARHREQQESRAVDRGSRPADAERSHRSSERSRRSRERPRRRCQSDAEEEGQRHKKRRRLQERSPNPPSPSGSGSASTKAPRRKQAHRRDRQRSSGSERARRRDRQRSSGSERSEARGRKRRQKR